MNSDGEHSAKLHPFLTGYIPNHIPSEDFDPVLSQFRQRPARRQWGTLELTRGDVEGVIKAKDPDLTIERVLEMVKAGRWYDFSAIGEHFDKGHEWASSFYKLAVSMKWIKGEDWWNGLQWWKERQELQHQRRIKRELRKRKREQKEWDLARQKLKRMLLKVLKDAGYPAKEAKILLPTLVKFNVGGLQPEYLASTQSIHSEDTLSQHRSK